MKENKIKDEVCNIEVNIDTKIEIFMFESRYDCFSAFSTKIGTIMVKDFDESNFKVNKLHDILLAVQAPPDDWFVEINDWTDINKSTISKIYYKIKDKYYMVDCNVGWSHCLSSVETLMDFLSNLNHVPMYPY